MAFETLGTFEIGTARGRSLFGTIDNHGIGTSVFWAEDWRLRVGTDNSLRTVHCGAETLSKKDLLFLREANEL